MVLLRQQFRVALRLLIYKAKCLANGIPIGNKFLKGNDNEANTNAFPSCFECFETFRYAPNASLEVDLNDRNKPWMFQGNKPVNKSPRPAQSFWASFALSLGLLARLLKRLAKVLKFLLGLFVLDLQRFLSMSQPWRTIILTLAHNEVSRS